MINQYQYQAGEAASVSLVYKYNHLIHHATEVLGFLYKEDMNIDRAHREILLASIVSGLSGA